MNLGKFKINAIETGIFGLDGGSMFGIVPKALWQRKYHQGDELNRIPLAARPILVQFDNRVLLIDTGNGNKFNDKFANLYNLDKEKSSILNALKLQNIEAEQVTDVILTHLHFDHSGGATIIQDNQIVPTFPNAKYYVQKEQLAWAKNPTEKDSASFIPDNYEPLIEHNQIEIIDGEGELFYGISIIIAYGHTKAMQMVKISDSDKSLYYLADTIPTSAHLPFTFSMGFDNFPLKVINEKKHLLPQIYEEKAILFFEHDAFLQAATIKSTEKGFSVDEKIDII
mgnify:CR=1 FL=1